MPIGDRNRKQEGDFISAADRNDLAERLTNIENGFASGNGGLSSSFLSGAGGGSVPIQVQPDIKPFQTRKTGSTTIQVGYLRPYEVAGGAELIQSKAIVDHINVLEITGTTRVIYPIEFPDAEEIELNYTGSGSNTQMSYIYYLISYDGTEGEWIATLSQKAVDSWPPTLNHRETVVIIGIIEVNTNVSGNPGGEWHQLLDENKTIEIINATSDSEYMPFDGVLDSGNNYDFQPGNIQIGEAEETYAGQTIEATANYNVYANIRIDATSSTLLIELYDEAGTTVTGELIDTASDLAPWIPHPTLDDVWFWRFHIGKWDSERVWTQAYHGDINETQPSFIVKADEVWITRSVNEFQHIGPSDATSLFNWVWNESESRHNFYINGVDLTEAGGIGADAHGHVDMEPQIADQWKRCDNDQNLAQVEQSLISVDFAWLCVGSVWVKGYNSTTVLAIPSSPSFLEQCGLTGAPTSCDDLTGWPARDDFSGTGCNSGVVDDNNWMARWSVVTFNILPTYSINGGAFEIILPKSTVGSRSIQSTLNTDDHAGDFTVQVDVNISSVDPSGVDLTGPTVSLYVELGGTQYEIFWGHSTVADGLGYYNGSTTVNYQQQRTGGSWTFKIARVGSTVSLYLDATVMTTITNAADVTAVYFRAGNGGGGTGSAASCVAKYDNFIYVDGSSVDIAIDPTGKACT